MVTVACMKLFYLDVQVQYQVLECELEKYRRTKDNYRPVGKEAGKKPGFNFGSPPSFCLIVAYSLIIKSIPVL